MAENKNDGSLDPQVIKLAVFENRWRYAVFPAMIAFFILSGFGFYLIYGMLERMAALSEDIDKMTRVMSESLPVMQGGVVGMSSKMQWVGDDLDKMSADVHTLAEVISTSMPSIENRLVNMATNINSMSHSTAAMAATTDNMGRNIWDMNRNISKPMSFFSDMMPWQRSNAPPPPGYYASVYQPYAQAVYRAPGSRTTEPETVNAGIEPEVDGGNSHQRSETDSTITVASANALEGKFKYGGFCASCHGVKAEGGVGPALNNNSASMISEVLHAYKSGAREGTMTGVVKTLSAHDIDNIAEFIGKNLDE